jgi:hypothetical protein
MKMRLLLMVALSIATLAACSGLGAGPAALRGATGSVVTGAIAPRAPQSARAKSAPRYVYWMPQGYGIGKYEFDSKNNKRTQYGSSPSTALTVDSQGSVYEAFGTYQTPGGVDVLDPASLQITRQILLPETFQPTAIAVDGQGEEYLSGINYPDPSTDFPEIEVFAAGASGTVSPIRVIAGSRTGLTATGRSAIVVDNDGYQYVANSAKQAPTNIVIFAPTVKGNVKPVREIGGSLTQLTDARNLALGADGNIYVANAMSNGDYSVVIFPRSANGNVAPIRVLNSGHYGPGIALGAGGEIYVGTSQQNVKNGFAIYAKGASGNDKPIDYLAFRFRAIPPYAIALSDPWYHP